MAQIVGFMEDNVVFLEGPFVISNPCENGWRIECELKGHHCPVLCDLSIYPHIKRLGMDGKTNEHNLAAMVCDTLNEMVRQGAIVNDGSAWAAKVS